jgi:ankyrin repeat protein
MERLMSVRGSSMLAVACFCLAVACRPSLESMPPYDRLYIAILNGERAAALLAIERLDSSELDRPLPGDGVPLLSYAACGDAMLLKGANVNARDRNGSTPLMAAAHQGNYGTALLLIRHGANPNLKGIYGFTPLHDAVFKRRLDVARLLVLCGADPRAPKDDGATSIDIASNIGASDFLRWLGSAEARAGCPAK